MRISLFVADLERRVEKFIGRGTGAMSVEIPFTPRAKAAVEIALEISNELGHSYIGTEHLLLGIVREGERILDIMGRGASNSLAFKVLQNLGVDPFTIQQRVMRTEELGTRADRERFSLQLYKERLRTLLPPMSSQALKVWHAMASQIGWDENDVVLSYFRIRSLTRLSESEVQAAVDELIELGVITPIEPI